MSDELQNAITINYFLAILFAAGTLSAFLCLIAPVDSDAPEKIYKKDFYYVLIGIILLTVSWYVYKSYPLGWICGIAMFIGQFFLFTIINRIYLIYFSSRFRVLFFIAIVLIFGFLTLNSFDQIGKTTWQLSKIEEAKQKKETK